MTKVDPAKYHPVRDINNFKDMLESSATLFAENPAFLVKKEKGGPYEQIKYPQLKHEIEALGTKLMELGLKDAKIAIIGENCYEWVVSYFAVANGTGIVVPLDKELNRDEVHHLLERSDCRAVFYTESYEDYFKNYKIDYRIKMKVYGDRTNLDELMPTGEPIQTDGGVLTDWSTLVAAGEKLLESGNRSFLDATVDPDVMKILLFTSGTTEAAKGVMLTHRNIMCNVMDTCSIVKILPSDRSLSILPIHHTFESTMGMTLMLYSGASVSFSEGLKYVAKNMLEAQPTVLIGVPLIFESLYDKIWKQAEKTGKAKVLKKVIKLNKATKSFGADLSHVLFKSVHEKFGGKLRLLIVGAAAINPNVCRGFEDLGLKVLQGYGLTECAPLVTGPPEWLNTYKKAGSAGMVVRSGELKVINLDEDGIGEIIFKGPNVMIGYYQMPEKTAEILKDGWFYTGDLGFIDDDGWIYLTGRKKNVIVTKTGKNIYPEEVEAYLNQHKYIQDSMVYGEDEDKSEDTLVSAQIIPAYEVIFEEFGENLSEERIQSIIKKAVAEINERFPVYKRVRGVVVRQQDFIRTTTKKIKRNLNMK